MLTADKV